MFWIRLEDVLKLCYEEQFNLIIRLENVLKMSWRRFQNILKTSWRRLEDVWPRRICWSWWRRLEDVFWRRMSKANIFLKTSWRRLLKTKTKDVFIKANVSWVPFWAGYMMNLKCWNMLGNVARYHWRQWNK